MPIIFAQAIAPGIEKVFPVTVTGKDTKKSSEANSPLLASSSSISVATFHPKPDVKVSALERQVEDLQRLVR